MTEQTLPDFDGTTEREHTPAYTWRDIITTGDPALTVARNLIRLRQSDPPYGIEAKPGDLIRHFDFVITERRKHAARRGQDEALPTDTHDLERLEMDFWREAADQRLRAEFSFTDRDINDWQGTIVFMRHTELEEYIFIATGAEALLQDYYGDGKEE